MKSKQKGLIPLVVASSSVGLMLALSLCSCTISKDGTVERQTATEQTQTQTESTPQQTTTTSTETTRTNNDGVSVHIGDGNLHVDTPLIKIEKNGKGDKLRVRIPEINMESK